MSAAPHETDGATPSLHVVPDRPAAPSLAQLLGHRTGRPQRVAPAAHEAPAPEAPREIHVYDPVVELPAVELPPVRRVPARAARPLREPTFDELVAGSGRHRGTEEPPGGGSLLRRLALRARLLPTPARRPPSRATGPR